MPAAPQSDVRSMIALFGQMLAGALLAGGILLPAQAQNVVLTGLTNDKALIVIDGAPPRFMSPGQSVQNVRLVGLQPPDTATVEIGGARKTLRMGEAPLSVGTSSTTGNGRRIVLIAGSGGHFTSQGQINGKSVPFLVDTGATTIVLSDTQARQLGLRPDAGQPVPVKTANGESTGRVVMLDSVRVGDVTVNGVAAIVLPAQLPYALLGNSFLSRFDMRRENDRMVLDQRY